MNIHTLTDLTLLDEQASAENIDTLVVNAINKGVAAVCVYPKHLSQIPSSLNRATVLNFPSGKLSHQAVMTTLEKLLVADGPNEIDYVFPYTHYLNGHSAGALAMCHDVYQHCVAEKRLFKVILETGVLPSAKVIQAISRALIEQGCDFLKTSTGKTTTGATLEAASAMLSAIRLSHRPCGIKISGGIRTIEQARAYIQLAEEALQKPVEASWFRIGTSSVFQ